MNKAPNFGTYGLCALWLAIAYFFWHELGPEPYMALASYRPATAALCCFYLTLFSVNAFYHLRSVARAMLTAAPRASISPTQRS